MPTDLRGAAGFLLGFWLALTLLGPLARPAAGQSATQPPGSALGPLEAALHRAVNDTRGQHHRIPLRRIPDLDRVARAHSDDMATRGYLSHETPEGANPVDRMQRAGVHGFSLAGENVGLTNRSDPNREILEGWLTSPDHRRNLLAPVFNATGIGVARAADGSLFYTQLYVTLPREVDAASSGSPDAPGAEAHAPAPTRQR